MAAQFKSGSSIVFTAATTTIVSDPAPSVVSGDYLLLFLNIESTSVSVTSIPGWSFVDSNYYWASGGQIYVYQRLADGTADDAPTVTVASTRDLAVVIACFDGQDGATPFGSNFTLVADSSSPITHGSLNAAANDALAVIAGWSYLTETGTFSYTNSFTPRIETVPSSAATFYLATKSVNAGAVGTTDVTNSSGILRVGAFTAVLEAASGPSGSIPIPLTGEGALVGQSRGFAG